MTILSAQDSIMLIIDIQERLLKSVYNKEEVEKNSRIMAKAADLLNIPVIITEQYPKGLGNTDTGLKSVLGKTSEYVEKVTFSAADTPEFSALLNRYSKKQIVIFGIETHICVSQTAAALVKAGYEVLFVSDASGSRTEKQHLAGVERMKSNGVDIITAEIALFEWLKSSKHEKFKEIQTLIK